MSADGRDVAFTSRATNLDPADLDPDYDVFVRDLATNDTSLATPGVDGAVLAALSADGRHIAYMVGDSGAPDPVEYGLLYVRDLLTGEVLFPAFSDGPAGRRANGYTNRQGVSLSADGSLVAFSSRASSLDPDDRDRAADLYVRDVIGNRTTLVSRADGRNGAKGNQASPSGGALSADGHYVAFTSFAWNLDPLDDRDDDESDVFVRDLRRSETRLANLSAGGRKGTLGSSDPSLSADGRYVAFVSNAENLTPDAGDITNDINSEPIADVFVRDVRAPTAAPGRRPRSRIDAVLTRRASYVVVGRARDDNGVLHVDLSLTRRVRTPSGYRCQAAKDTPEGQFWVSTASAGRRCRPQFYWQATSTRRWRVLLPRDIAPGAYTLTSRATDTAGQHERGFNRARGNVRSFRATGSPQPGRISTSPEVGPRPRRAR
jgi:WD40-like Beta Propeller Repeat